MTSNAVLQVGLYLVVLLACIKPLGSTWHACMQQCAFVRSVLRPLERLLYRLSGIDQEHEMTAREYAIAVLTFSFVSFATVYGVQRVQDLLPANPECLPAIATRPLVQHGGELCDEHELAEL